MPFGIYRTWTWGLWDPPTPTAKYSSPKWSMAFPLLIISKHQERTIGIIQKPRVHPLGQ